MKENHVVIIAEAGVNHNGNLEIAKRLIDAAAEAGVDYVKFQTFKADDLVSKSAKQAEYQKKNLNSDDDSQYEMLKSLELSEANHEELILYCNTKGIQFFSTAFDVKGLNYLNNLDFKQFKVPSGEITNYPYLKRLSEMGKPVILSTGMADLTEIEAAVRILEKGILRKDITVLHCNTDYPTPMQDVNLKAMLTIARKLGVEVGYSDHTLGIEVPIAAVALGARVIEKHFTLDRNMKGPDHAASLEPDELKQMVSGIRNIELAIAGNGEKIASPGEYKNRTIVRKSIHLSKDLEAGHVLRDSDLCVLRPAEGISPMDWEKVLGKKLVKNMKAMSSLQWSDILS